MPKYTIEFYGPLGASVGDPIQIDAINRMDAAELYTRNNYEGYSCNTCEPQDANFSVKLTAPTDTHRYYFSVEKNE